VVEDAPAGIQARRAAGMRVIDITSTVPVEELSSAMVIASRLADIEILQK